MKNVVIIGGGASGTILTIALLGALTEADQIVVVEPRDQLGSGIAYAPNSAGLLLNVRASGMSIFPDKPGDFVDWLSSKGHFDTALKFMSRDLFGDYVRDRLDQALSTAKAKLIHLKATAESVLESEDGFQVVMNGGLAVDRVTHIVVAVGNQLPTVPIPLKSILDSNRVILDPLSSFESQLDPSDTVLVLGSGLTCIDVLMKLLRADWSSRVLVRSRSGRLPQSHAEPVAVPSWSIPSDDRVGVRTFIKACREAGDNWRPVVDSVRRQTSAVWQSWEWADRGKFLKRFGTLWNIHRHRVPPEVMELISKKVDQGVLAFGRGSLQNAEFDGKQVHLTFDSETITCDRVVCCTTPQGLSQARLPIIEAMVASGLTSHDPLGIGLVVDDGLRLNHKNAYGLGPVAKGCLLESTAIPEIRVQAQTVAKRIVDAF